jgi:hypothetical protein
MSGLANGKTKREDNLIVKLTKRHHIKLQEKHDKRELAFANLLIIKFANYDYRCSDQT